MGKIRVARYLGKTDSLERKAKAKRESELILLYYPNDPLHSQLDNRSVSLLNLESLLYEHIILSCFFFEGRAVTLFHRLSYNKELCGLSNLNKVYFKKWTIDFNSFKLTETFRTIRDYLILLLN
jgi:hypothetical protein